MFYRIEMITDETKDERMQNILQRVEALEYATFYPSNFPLPSQTEHEQMMRARKRIILMKLYSTQFSWVPDHYYSLSLKQRAAILNAGSTSQLCKSMLIENRAFDLSSFMDEQTKCTSNMYPFYSQFYLVVLQYEAVMSTKKMQSEVRALMPLRKRLEPSKYDFRVASDQDNDRLTGFMHNAVTPFGMKCNVPIILAKAIVSDKGMSSFIWLGGGHVHLKLGISTNEFIEAMNPLILDVTEHRKGSF